MRRSHASWRLLCLRRRQQQPPDQQHRALCRGRGLSTTRAFDSDIAVTAATEKGKGVYKAHVSNRWSIGDAPNGGYLKSIAITAARNELKFQDPLSVSVHFVSKAREDAEAEVKVDVLNTGRTTQTCEVSLVQEGKLRSRYLMVFGALSSFKGLNYSTLRAPELPSLDQTIDAMDVIAQTAGDAFRIGRMLELRICPTSPFARGALRRKQAPEARMEGWVAFRDGRKPCLRSMALFNDGFPPTVLNLASFNWVPTLELTTHFWNRPPKGADAPQYLRARFETRYVSQGLLMADSEIWSHDGSTLYSTSRQLARVLPPPQASPHSSPSLPLAAGYAP